MTMPLVSILIPVYNSPFFADALNSALDQTFRNFELIVSDDSDNDCAFQTVSAKFDPRIRYIRNKPSLGFGGNFAQCFRLATGKYIKFLNHDDRLHPDCVAQMVDAFEQLRSDISLVVSRRARINSSGEVLPDDEQTLPISLRNGRARGLQLGNHCLTRSANRIGEPSAVMFRRTDITLNRNSLFCIHEREYTCLADLALWLRLLAQGDAYYIADPVCDFRVHDEQLQMAAPARTLCRVERFYLPRDARRLGFLNESVDYRNVLDQSIKHVQWAASFPEATDEERQICTDTLRDISLELARTE